MSQKIFRQAALDKLATPEELDKMIQVTNLRGWIALGGLALIVVAALTWSILGSLPTVVKAGGVLIRQDGIQDIQLPNGGVVTNLSLKPGDPVKEGQVIAQVRDENGVTQPLTSPFAGTVLEVLVSNNTPVKPQSTIVRIEQDTKPLKTILLMSLADGKQIKPGTRVQLSPTTVQAQEYGQLLGTVSFVSQLPVSADSLLNQLKSPELVTALSGNAPAIEVDVTLDTDPSTPSGLKWTTQNGPPFKLTNGTLCAANLVVGEQRPLDLVLPIFKGGSQA
jgi:hypothetical protein